jgi:hypothetical protein
MGASKFVFSVGAICQILKSGFACRITAQTIEGLKAQKAS